MTIPIKIKKLSLPKLLSFIENRRVAIPEFQRGYVWKVKQIRNLFDSLIKHYPIGSFIIWETRKNIEARPINGDKLGGRKYLIIDGQQRMATIYYLCRQKKFIEHLIKQKFHETCDSRQKQLIDFEFFHFNKKGKRCTLNYSKDHSCRFDYNCFMRILGKNYYFPVIAVSIDNYQKAVEIFERINQAGTRISTESIFLSETWNKRSNLGKILRIWRKDNPESLTKDIDTVIFIHVFAIILQLESRLLGKSDLTFIDVSIKTLKKIADIIRESKKDSYEKVFRNSIKAIANGMAYLKEEYGISKIADLPSQTMLTVLSIFFYYQKRQPTELQGIELKKWFWRSSLSSRYIGSGYNRNIGPDAKLMKELAINSIRLNLKKVKIMLSDFEKIDLYTGRSTLRNSVKQMLWLQKPVSINGSSVQRSDVERKTHQKENDHFFPYNFFRKGYIGNEINNILNLHYLSKQENDIKSKQIPSVWLSKRINELGASKRNVKEYFKTNLFPFRDVHDLKKFESNFILGNKKVDNSLFPKYYKKFQKNRYKIFIKKFEKLQNGK